jgi:hypothetical protein
MAATPTAAAGHALTGGNARSRRTPVHNAAAARSKCRLTVLATLPTERIALAEKSMPDQ